MYIVLAFESQTKLGKHSPNMYTYTKSNNTILILHVQDLNLVTRLLLRN